MAKPEEKRLGVAAGLGLPRPVMPRSPAITAPPHAPSFEGSVELPFQRPFSDIVSAIVISHGGRTRLQGLSNHLGWAAGDILITEQVAVDLDGPVPGLLVYRPTRKQRQGTLLDHEYRLVIQSDDRNYLGLGPRAVSLFAAVRDDERTECLLIPASAIGRVVGSVWPK